MSTKNLEEEIANAISNEHLDERENTPNVLKLDYKGEILDSIESESNTFCYVLSEKAPLSPMELNGSNFSSLRTLLKEQSVNADVRPQAWQILLGVAHKNDPFADFKDNNVFVVLNAIVQVSEQLENSKQDFFIYCSFLSVSTERKVLESIRIFLRSTIVYYLFNDNSVIYQKQERNKKD
uniref:Uncharacterized protein n=1 Tax=Romanomermis culicivorax TaxID=13658 RepID=A0A915ICE7_ROMCU